jgi:hypothetical protein
MTGIGIRKIEYIQAAYCSPWEFLPRSGDIVLASYLSSTLHDLPFTQDSASFSEEWSDDDPGKSATDTLSFSIRADRNTFRPTLAQLLGGRYVFVVTTVDGVRRVVGSRYVPSVVTLTDTILGVTKSEYVFTAKCQSRTGALFAV